MMAASGSAMLQMGSIFADVSEEQLKGIIEQRFFKLDGPDAMAWAKSLPNEHADAARNAIGRNWGRKQPTGTMNLIEELKASPERDQLFKSVAISNINRVEWLRGIGAKEKGLVREAIENAHYYDQNWVIKMLKVLDGGSEEVIFSCLKTWRFQCECLFMRKSVTTSINNKNASAMRIIAVSLALFFCSSAVAGFVHPGVVHSQASIDFVKSKLVAKEEPWATAWKKLEGSESADPNWKPRPYADVERGPSNNPNIGSSDFSRDGKAAYTLALCWTLTGDVRYVKKAAVIVDAWSATLKSIGNHDARLLVGMSAYHFCIAAELIKHTWDGWPEEKQAKFRSMLTDICYPIIENFYPSANGNWDASMLQAMIAMGVFLDDQAMFDRAKDYYLKGEGNGAIGNYFKESGQCQETGRDQAHTQMGLEFLSNTCETAWIQGVDLYEALDNRLLKGFEYTAKYNLGQDVPYEPYKSFEGRYHYKAISSNSRGGLRPMYEKIFNHYHNRKGLEGVTFTKQAAMKLRNHGRRRSSSELDTLMFAGKE
jgi:hypothetical protein